MKIRYTLTVNSKNKKELDMVLSEMNKQVSIPKILKLDACFGPCENGSYISMFSSDDLSESGFVKEMDNFKLSAFFAGLAKMLPSNKFTLRCRAEEDSTQNITQTWNVYKVRDKTRSHVN